MSNTADKPGERGEADADPMYRQIIRQWDIARDRGDFPHLVSDVHWTFGKAHLTCFRSPDEWLTVFQLLTYSPGWPVFPCPPPLVSHADMRYNPPHPTPPEAHR